jgi:hypothetical protein
MKACELISHLVKAEVGYVDRDVLRVCAAPDEWDEMYSPLQLESALERLPEHLHHAVLVADLLDEERFQRLEAAAQSVRKALEAAYRGSAENGSFFRGARGEYVPSAFMSMNELEDAIAELKKAVGQ